ncbi:MAG TPA: glycosyltransferase family 2 protein [Bordetella sp.]
MLVSESWMASKAATRHHAYLVRGEVTGHAKAHVVDLILELNTGETHAMPVLVTRKGLVLELVKVPGFVRSMRLAEQMLQGKVEQLSCRPLRAAEYRLRQIYRVTRSIVKHPAKRRGRVGLTVKTLLTNLDKAYDAAVRFRTALRRSDYHEWHKEFYSISDHDRRVMARRLARWKTPPRFHITILTQASGEAALQATRESLATQIYSHFDVVELPADRWSCAWAARQATGQDRWCMVLRAGTQLAEQALYCLADSALRRPNASVIYTDHDSVSPKGDLHVPIFKPDWSPELLRSTNYIGETFAWNSQHAACLHVAPVADSHIDTLHGMLLSLTAGDTPVVHTPAPLLHLPPEPVHADDTSHVVAQYLRQLRIPATVVATSRDTCRVHYPVAQPAPMVSIIIPTRDELDHLQRCVSSVLEKTQYQVFEILVVDNQSRDPATLEYLQTLSKLPNVRVLPFDRPFNYSKINNMAVREAKGELVCLLNNDTEVISPDWLDEMAGLLLRNDVGAVGAKLLFDNGTVQHAGDTVGPGGCANHLHSGIGADEPGYNGRALVAQDLSSVTAACLLTKKAVYQSLGGLNEANLTVAFNDVDYCLNVRQMGLRVVWTPHALLYHHESITRGKDETRAQLRRAKKEVRYMRKRWAHVMQNDPFYNPNLNYLQPDFALSATPNVLKPWADSF